jgi:hypothetical protein
MNHALAREQAVLQSMTALAGAPASASANLVKALSSQIDTYNSWLDQASQSRGAKENAPASPWAADTEAKRVPVRIGDFGPLTYQNDNVLLARLGKDRYAQVKLINANATPLLNFQSSSDLYAYEIVNFINGKRSVGEIRDAVSAEYGPIPLPIVVDYLNACAEAKIIQWQ